MGAPAPVTHQYYSVLVQSMMILMIVILKHESLIIFSPFSGISYIFISETSLFEHDAEFVKVLCDMSDVIVIGYRRTRIKQITDSQQMRTVNDFPPDLKTTFICIPRYK